LAESVIADAQFGTSKILRPYAGFEADYQGEAANIPIVCSEVIEGTGGAPLDGFAGRAGYASNLIRGLSVPFGSRVLIWIPNIDYAPSLTPQVQVKYQWNIQWRLRNVFDYRQQRIPFQFPKQGDGVPDTTTGSPVSQVVIPASSQSVIYTVPDNTADLYEAASQTARNEAYRFGSLELSQPLLPGTTGVSPPGDRGAFQQGLLDPATFPGTSGKAFRPMYGVLELQAAGNELVISLNRSVEAPATGTWDFSQAGLGVDANVGIQLGLGYTVPPAVGPFQDIGVYVHYGTAP